MPEMSNEIISFMKNSFFLIILFVIFPFTRSLLVGYNFHYFKCFLHSKITNLPQIPCLSLLQLHYSISWINAIQVSFSVSSSGKCNAVYSVSLSGYQFCTSSLQISSIKGAVSLHWGITAVTFM